MCYMKTVLLQTLKDNPKIESAWCAYGSVWGKPANGGKRIKFQLRDDVDKKISDKLKP
jgi:hypothetical protein